MESNIEFSDCITFIIKRVDDFAFEHPNVKIKYLCDEYYGDHIIEIFSKKIYDTDENLRWRCEFIGECADKFETECVIIVTDDRFEKCDDVKLIKEWN